MVETALVVPTNYYSLRNEVRGVLLRGQREIESLKLQYYWEMGHLISQYLKTLPPHKRETRKLMERLTSDLQVVDSTLYRVLKFAETYPQGLDTCPNLTWSHYRALLAVSDSVARKALMQKTSEEGWSVRELKLQIQKEKGPKKMKALPVQSKLIEPVRKASGIFKVGWMQTVGEAKELVASLGFEIYDELPRVRLKAGETIQWQRNAWVRGGEKDALYYYHAKVERVVDGDTLLVHIHFANGMRTRRYLRLRGIDAAPLKKPAGQRAKEWLARQIKKQPELLVKTHLTDKYDRYIADVWAGDVYLNQALLDAGHAQRAY